MNYYHQILNEILGNIWYALKLLLITLCFRNEDMISPTSGDYDIDP
jgi:hypothetical protein